MMNQECRTVDFDGFTWELRLPSNIDTEIAEGRWWDVEVHDWICAYVKPGMICVDAGANIGAFTMLMAREVGDRGYVYAFEPCPSFVERLRQHLEINGVQNAAVQTVALGDESGPVLCLPDGPPYRSTARVGKHCKGPQATAVEMMTMDTFFLPRKRPGFVKIDVDGCEMALLEGGRKTIERAKPIIVIEIPLSDEGIEIAGFLVDRGYRLRKGRHSEPVEVRQLGPSNAGGTLNVLALPDGPGSWNEEM